MRNITINFDDLFIRGDMPGIMVHVTADSEWSRWHEEDEKFAGSTYYLFPFRAYDFQVCGTVNGEWDHGSSPVIGLGNLVNIDHNGDRSSLAYGMEYWATTDNVTHALLKGQAMLALYNCTKGGQMIIESDAIHGDAIDTFISLCMLWLSRRTGYQEKTDAAVDNFLTDFRYEDIPETFKEIAKIYKSDATDVA